MPRVGKKRGRERVGEGRGQCSVRCGRLTMKFKNIINTRVSRSLSPPLSPSLSLSHCIFTVFVGYINKLIFISRFAHSLPDLLPDKLSSGSRVVCPIPTGQLSHCPTVRLHNEWIIDKEIIFNWIQIHSWMGCTELEWDKGGRRGKRRNRAG